jgi:hypothetical protein
VNNDQAVLFAWNMYADIWRGVGYRRIEVDYSISIHFHGATTLAFFQFFLKNKLKKTTKYFWFQSRAPPINPLVAYVFGT